MGGRHAKRSYRWKGQAWWVRVNPWLDSFSEAHARKKASMMSDDGLVVTIVVMDGQASIQYRGDRWWALERAWLVRLEMCNGLPR